MVDRYLSAVEVAEMLGLSKRTLARWRMTGAGPAFHKFGNQVRYKLSYVTAWAAAQNRGHATRPKPVRAAD